MPVVDLAHLIALKLYSGGSKSRNDVAELIERNPDADLGAITAVCKRYALGDELLEILRGRGRGPRD